MITISQAVIVEGKYDKIKLSSLIDALILEINGFHIFKDKAKAELIKTLAMTRGIIIKLKKLQKVELYIMHIFQKFLVKRSGSPSHQNKAF